MYPKIPHIPHFLWFRSYDFTNVYLSNFLPERLKKLIIIIILICTLDFVDTWRNYSPLTTSVCVGVIWSHIARARYKLFNLNLNFTRLQSSQAVWVHDWWATCTSVMSKSSANPKSHASPKLGHYHFSLPFSEEVDPFKLSPMKIPLIIFITSAISPQIKTVVTGRPLWPQNQ